uniref:Uncharacterized protein n=1 Tax=Oncorhynchus mykiss TaxID=8022 RepID=A0A8C7R256_ONCMY
MVYHMDSITQPERRKLYSLALLGTTKRNTEITKDFTWRTPKSPKCEFETKCPLVRRWEWSLDT